MMVKSTANTRYCIAAILYHNKALGPRGNFLRLWPYFISFPLGQNRNSTPFSFIMQKLVMNFFRSTRNDK